MKIDKLSTTHTGVITAFPELRGSFAAMRFPCFGEVKYDGEATYIHFKAKAWIWTVNKYGTCRKDWWVLAQIAQVLENAGVKEALLQGELYWGMGKAGALYELLSHKADDDLNISLFDMPYMLTDTELLNGNTAPLIDRRERMEQIFDKDPSWLVGVKVLNDKDAAIDHFETITNLGYEGIVLKSFDGFTTTGPCSWVKMKRKDRTNYIVNLIDPVKERIEILAQVPGKAPVVVGVKCANKYKKTLKIGDMVEIEHQGVLPSGSLRHPVYCGKEKNATQ